MAEQTRRPEGIHPVRLAGCDAGLGVRGAGAAAMPSRGAGVPGMRGGAIRGDASGLARPDRLGSDEWEPLPGAVRQEIPHTRNKNGVGMNEWEQQVLAGSLAELGERVERLAQLAEEVASALGAMTGPASALLQEPAGKAA